MLDSECMMPDDQGMTEEWIVRVEGREYGPADIETLREWKADGRLLPANEARRVNVDLWTTAAEIPGLFDITALAPAIPRQLTQPPRQISHRSFTQILARTFQIYRTGFLQFVGLTLLILLPSICSQLTTAFVQPPHGSSIDLPSVLAAGFAFFMFILSIVMWPVYIAGIQILTAEIARGNRPGLVARAQSSGQVLAAHRCLVHLCLRRVFPAHDLRIVDRGDGSCRGIFNLVAPCRDGFAHLAGLDVRPFFRERSVLAAVCRP